MTDFVFLTYYYMAIIKFSLKLLDFMCDIFTGHAYWAKMFKTVKTWTWEKNVVTTLLR